MEAIDHSRTELDDHENDQHVNVHNVNNSHKKLLSPGTPVQKSITSTRRSPLTKLLIYPTPTQKISKAKSCARVLTSAESTALLEDKARKKREEQEEKEQKRVKRKLLRKKKKRKAEERQAKQKAEQKRANGQKRNSSSDGSRCKRQRLDIGEDEGQDTGI